ncbi:MAG: DUF2325 domain-containing protein [Chloroflexota bacterium]|nr:DUF2325 domain-containing protein [Chloroflexota bacterium]
MIAPKRRLWEFYGPIICRLVGLTFDEDQANQILKKVKSGYDQEPSTFPAKHGALVQACSQQNEVSKYAEKILERQFEPYRNLVEGVDQKDICRFIEGEHGIDGLQNIPLPTLIWFTVRNQHEDTEEIEFRVFNAIHMKEHQALRLYDTLSRVLPDGKVENVLEELKGALKTKEELQKRYKRSERKREQLKLEVEAIKKGKSQVTLALAEQKELDEKLKRDLGKLGGQLALVQIESLKNEIELLHQEIQSLTQELLHQELYGASSIIDEPATEVSCHSELPPLSLRAERSNLGDPSLMLRDDMDEEQDAQLSLKGMKVVFVGGLQSLVPYYRRMVDNLGGVCEYHEECRGRREAENLVGSADMVFCPIDMNSHSCIHCIKRVCRLTGKPCCFLRSSGLSTFVRGLVDFAWSLG